MTEDEGIGSRAEPDESELIRKAVLRREGETGECDMQIKNMNGDVLFEGDFASLQGANLDGANLEGANLGRANLEGANLGRANLEDAYLWGANLASANLEGANLDGANLGRANLEGANLGRANLEDAYLWGANLASANLEGANLASANLRGANLWGANLASANLEGANLASANLRGANLRGANLRGAQGIIQGPMRSDGYIFFLVQHTPPMVLAGCRWMTIAHFHEHIAEPGYEHICETAAILGFLEAEAKRRGWIND